MHWYTDVLKKYAEFSGRATRQQFWMFVLINLLISIAVGIIGGILHTKILGNLYSLALLIPSLAVGARRLHDMGKSGWWQLLMLIPILGWIIMIVFLATDTQPIDNQYGPNPKGGNTPVFAATPPVEPVVEKTEDAPVVSDEVVINDLPLAEPSSSPEEKA